MWLFSEIKCQPWLCLFILYSQPFHFTQWFDQMFSWYSENSTGCHWVVKLWFSQGNIQVGSQVSGLIEVFRDCTFWEHLVLWFEKYVEINIRMLWWTLSTEVLTMQQVTADGTVDENVKNLLPCLLRGAFCAEHRERTTVATQTYYSSIKTRMS